MLILMAPPLRHICRSHKLYVFLSSISKSFISKASTFCLFVLKALFFSLGYIFPFNLVSDQWGINRIFSKRHRRLHMQGGLSWWELFIFYRNFTVRDFKVEVRTYLNGLTPFEGFTPMPYKRFLISWRVETSVDEKSSACTTEASENNTSYMPKHFPRF